MAEKFMTRRERREAERRAADVAFDAQQESEADDAQELAAAPEADTVEASEAAQIAEEPVPDEPVADESVQDSEPFQNEDAVSDPGPDALEETGSAEPVLPERPAVAPASILFPQEKAALEAPLQSSEAIQFDEPTQPEEPAQPDEPAQPEEPAQSEDPALYEESSSAADTLSMSVPQFSTRGERKRFLREHNLPADIPTASIPIVLAEREAGDDAASQEVAVPEETPEPTAEEDSSDAPVLLWGDHAESVQQTADDPTPSSTAGWGEAFFNSQSVTVKSGARESGVVGGDLAQQRVNATPSGPDFETSSTAVITPSALGEYDAPLKRRTPVVKPPTGANIRVVTGAMPIITPADLEEEPPTTPLWTIEESQPDSNVTGSPSYSFGRSDSDDDDEGSEEVDTPPAPPMSARSVTHEDGEVLVAERNSMAPYIVLGAAGAVALALIVAALFLLL